MSRFVTPKEVAAATGLDYRSVLREIEDGKLPAYKLRGRLRIKYEDLERWLEMNAVRPRIVPEPEIAGRPSEIPAEVGILRA